MLKDRRTFLQHFVICLAMIAAFALAWIQGTPQAIFATDVSYTTSVITGLVAFAAAYMGWQAWSVDSYVAPFRRDGRRMWRVRLPTAHFGLFAAGLCPLIGLFGTSTGLRANISALASGASGLTPLGTSIVTMQAGVLGAIIILLLLFNLESGIRRHEEG